MAPLAIFMPALMGGLATITASIVGRVVLALGIGFVTYTGISAGIDAIQAQVISSVSGLTGDSLALVGYLWIDKAISVIFSAVSVSIAMRGIGGSVKKMVFK